MKPLSDFSDRLDSIVADLKKIQIDWKIKKTAVNKKLCLAHAC